LALVAFSSPYFCIDRFLLAISFPLIAFWSSYLFLWSLYLCFWSLSHHQILPLIAFWST
jgi:hypothetical protein